MTNFPLSIALLTLIEESVPPGSTIATVSEGKPNWITDVTASGVRVETEASRRKGSGPQLVPGWMLQAGWDQLRKTGRLSQTQLLNDLNVKRSAAVCAILACLPNVSTASTRPVILAMEEQGRPV